MSRAANAHDLVAVRAAMADDCLIEDHRQLRVIDLQGADGYVALLQSVLDLVSDYCVEAVRVHRLEPWGHVSLTHSIGATSDGAPFEQLVLAYIGWGPDGRVSTLALYEPEDVDAALERLASDDPALRREPSVWDRFGRLVRAYSSLPVLASRGEHLAILQGPERLTVVEVDEDAQEVRSARFDADQLDAAYVTLDQWFLDERDPDLPPCTPIANGELWLNRDWEAYEALLAPDLESCDHRVAGQGDHHSREEFLAFVRPMREQLVAIDMQYVHYLEHERGSINATDRTGSVVMDDEGNVAEFETRLVVVQRWNDDGLIDRMDLYDEVRIEDAFARYDGEPVD